MPYQQATKVAEPGEGPLEQPAVAIAARTRLGTIRVLLVDDYEIVRKGIRSMIELEPDISVEAEATNGQQALELMKSYTPDVLLIDVKMPGMNGIELTRRIKSTWPDAKVLILTMYSEYLDEAIAAGALGYLSKDLPRATLVQAIRSVFEGRSPVHFTMEHGELSRVLQPRSDAAALSERENAVLKLIAEGAVDKEIAVQLSISETTVKRTLSHIFDKLGAKTRAEAVAEAIRRGMI
ncbi:MAG: response regulator transcription factor [Chloroflexi bacterium]|nr:response regulator transcription factor [Chloroflexota bacterium]